MTSNPTDEIAQGCTGCGVCAKACAVLAGDGGNNGAALLPSSLAADGEALQRAAGQCTLCGLCDTMCPRDLPVTSMMRQAREMAFAENLCGARKRGRGGRLYQLLGRSLPFRALLRPRGVARDGVSTVFFPGCNLSGARPRAVELLYGKIRQVEPEAGLLLDCCSILLRDVGDRAGFADTTGAFASRLRKAGVRKVISACPSCISAMKSAGMEGEFSLQSAYELLEDDAAQEDAACGDAVRIHDACSARGDERLQRSVRRLAGQSGFSVEEHPHSGERTFCCTHADFHLGGGNGGAVYVTSCAGCLQTLTNSVKARHLLDLYFDAPDGDGVEGFGKRLVNRLALKRNVKKLLAG